MKRLGSTVARWGNSLAVRVPQEIAKGAGLREGDAVDISLEESAVKIRRAKPRYTLDELIVGMTPKNRQPETDWGPDVGAERFWEDE